jgi:hypothetical protein
VLLLLGTAAIYETAIALGALSVGPAPGQGPPGADSVLAASMLAFLIGAWMSVVYAVWDYPVTAPPAWLLAPVATWFVAARFYAFDPYFAPTLRRYSEGVVPELWIFGLCAAALGAAVLTRAWSRLGMCATGVVFMVCALTAVWEGVGH